MPDIGQAWWLAPNNIVYDVPHTHWGWMMDNKPLLTEKYGIDTHLFEAYDFGGYGNIECNLLIDKGWIQIRLNKGQLNVIMTTEGEIDRVFSFIKNNNIEFKFIAIDSDGGFEIYNKKYFYDNYGKNTIAGKRQSNNDANEAWWIAPDNMIFEVPEDLSHWGWMQQNKKLLSKKYGLDAERSEIWDFVGKGWIRVHRFNNKLVIDYNGSSNLTRVVNMIYDKDIIKNLNGILNIRDVSVQNINGQTSIIPTKDFLRKYSKLYRIKNIKQEIINEFLQ